MTCRRRVSRRDRRSDRGASLVEFVVAAPVFLMLIVGIFNGANVVDQRIQVSHAARDGARYGASLGLQTGWAATVAKKITNSSAGDFAGSGVCVALVTGPGANPTVVTTGTPIDASTRVVVSIAGRQNLNWIFGTNTQTWLSTSTALWEPYGQYSGAAGIPASSGLTAADFSLPSGSTCDGTSGNNQYAFVPGNTPTTPAPPPATSPPSTIAVLPPPFTFTGTGNTNAYNQPSASENVNCALHGLHQGHGPVSTCNSVGITTSLLMNGVAPAAGYTYFKAGDVFTVQMTMPAIGGNNAMYQETVDGIRNNQYDEFSYQDVMLPPATGTYLSAPQNITMSRTDNGDRGNGPAINCLFQNGDDSARSDAAQAVPLGGAQVGSTKMSTGIYTNGGNQVLRAAWNQVSIDRCNNVYSNNGEYAGFTLSFTQQIIAMPVAPAVLPATMVWTFPAFAIGRTNGSAVINWGDQTAYGWQQQS